MGETKLVVRVYFVDDAFRTLLVKSTITAAELCTVVADKVSLVRRETFALFYMRGGEGRCLDSDEQPLKVMVTEIAGLDADFSKYTEKSEWDKIKKEWEKESRLVFKRRVFLNYKPINKEDEVFLHYSFIQAVANVRDGTYPCYELTALELASLQMQVTFGNHNKKRHVPGFLKDKIDRFIPAPLLKSPRKLEEWEKDIFNEHARISGIKKSDAMLQYLNKVRTWKFYGSTFWNVKTINKENSSLPDNVTLAVSSSGIQLLKPQSKDPIIIQRYADIYSWAYKRNAFAFVSGVLSKQKFQFVTPYGKDIARTLQAYVEILLEERKKGNPKKNQSKE